MREGVRQRMREHGPEPESLYEIIYERREQFLARQHQGKVVIWPQERDWELCKQGKVKGYLMPTVFTDTVLQDWLVFTQVFPPGVHSGKHRHQGGLVIFALEGEGTTTMDGVPYDWGDGDLMILPVKENGVLHQHFNRKDDADALWLAFINLFIWDQLGSEFEQVEMSPLWTAQQARA